MSMLMYEEPRPASRTGPPPAKTGLSAKAEFCARTCGTKNNGTKRAKQLHTFFILCQESRALLPPCEMACRRARPKVLVAKILSCGLGGEKYKSGRNWFNSNLGHL